MNWSDSIKIPIILGTLHLDRQVDNPYYKYKVYNSVFLLDSGEVEFEHYHKIKLVPFSEGLPFEGFFPILSRLNLGESDFYRGSDEKVFSIKILNKFIEPQPTFALSLGPTRTLRS